MSRMLTKNWTIIGFIVFVNFTNKHVPHRGHILALYHFQAVHGFDTDAAKLNSMKPSTKHYDIVVLYYYDIIITAEFVHVTAQRSK